MRHKPNASCAVCAAPFYSQPGRPGTYCSKRCFGLAHRQNLERTCAACGSIFTVKPWELRRRAGRFCSVQCNGEGNRRRKTTDPIARFWSHVDTSGECWTWKLSTHGYLDGYGNFTIHRRPKLQNIPAHRFSWELHNGPIPDGLWVLHHCDNPPCVRPEHLFLGTAQDNVDDMMAKGRQIIRHLGWGEQHPNAKLTNADAVEIRRLYAHEGLSQAEIARRYGVRDGTIARIRKGISYPG